MRSHKISKEESRSETRLLGFLYRERSALYLSAVDIITPYREGERVKKVKSYKTVIMDSDGRPVNALMTEPIDVSEEDLEIQWVKKEK